MRNVNKKIITIIIMILAICQITNRVNAYTRDEVINMIDYQVIEDDDENSTSTESEEQSNEEEEDEDEEVDYDVLVYLDNFEVDETIPCYTTSVDTVLYKNYGLFDINFFNTNLDKHKKEDGEYDTWVDIRNNVVKVFRVSLYISIVIMLTLLIYIAIILVSEPLSIEKHLPMAKEISTLIHKPVKTVERNTIEKRLIEQWFIALLVIVLVPFGLSVIVYFSNTVSNITYKKLEYKSSVKQEDDAIEVSSNQVSNNEVTSNQETDNDINTASNANESGEDEIECNYIKVFAKYKIKPVVGGSSGSGSYINPTTPLSGKIMMIGDSRTVGLQDANAADNPNVIWICEGSKEYNWMVNEAFPKADNLIESGMAVVIWLGVNDGLGDLSAVEGIASKYVTAISQKANEWGSKGATVCFASVGPTRYSRAGLMPGIQKFNEYMRNNLPSNVSYIDLYNAIMNEPGGWSTDGGGLHYHGNNDKTHKYIFNYIKSQLGMGVSPESNDTSTGDSALSQELRQKVIDQAKSLENLGVGGGYCEMWVESVYRKALNRNDSQIPRQCCAHKAGRVSIVSTSETDIIPGAAVFSYKSSSKTSCKTSGEDAGHVGIYIGDGKIASCTGRGNTGIVIHTIDEWKQSWQFSGWGWLPGTTDLANGAIAQGTSGSQRVVDDTEYTFMTSLEGLMDYESQYISEDTRLKAWSCGVIGGVLSAFKIFLFGLFFIRMVGIAVIIAFSPILTLINAFMKITNGKSILGKMFMIFMYLALLKPVIGVAYETLIRDHVEWHEQLPLTILPILIGIVIMVILSFIKLYQALKIRGFVETVMNKMKNIKNRILGI